MGMSGNILIQITYTNNHLQLTQAQGYFSKA